MLIGWMLLALWPGRDRATGTGTDRHRRRQWQAQQIHARPTAKGSHPRRFVFLSTVIFTAAVHCLCATSSFVAMTVLPPQSSTTVSLQKHSCVSLVPTLFEAKRNELRRRAKAHKQGKNVFLFFRRLSSLRPSLSVLVPPRPCLPRGDGRARSLLPLLLSTPESSAGIPGEHTRQCRIPCLVKGVWAMVARWLSGLIGIVPFVPTGMHSFPPPFLDRPNASLTQRR